MSKKEEYYFAKTRSGGRTNIYADFIVVNHETFIKDFLSKEDYGMWRYAKLGEPMDNLKGMSLKEYEIIFEGIDLNVKKVTNSFRKEISLKYGEHKELSKIKPIKKSDLVLGGIYEDFSGHSFVYLGKATESVSHKGYNQKNIKKEGNAFANVHKYSDYKIRPHSIDVLKGIKKLKSSTGKIKDNVHNKYVDKGYRGTVEYTLHEF